MFQARWVRTSIIVGIVVASFASALAIAYELALARVPRHRAALESLVRSQTGLDVRFNELTLRWGWYGPEAVFRRVELGEPGEGAPVAARQRPSDELTWTAPFANYEPEANAGP